MTVSVFVSKICNRTVHSDYHGDDESSLWHNTQEFRKCPENKDFKKKKRFRYAAPFIQDLVTMDTIILSAQSAASS